MMRVELMWKQTICTPRTTQWDLLLHRSTSLAQCITASCGSAGHCFGFGGCSKSYGRRENGAEVEEDVMEAITMIPPLGNLAALLGDGLGSFARLSWQARLHSP